MDGPVRRDRDAPTADTWVKGPNHDHGESSWPDSGRRGPPGHLRAPPGPASPPDKLAAELTPPLSLLEEVEAEARRIREEAARVAADRRREAERQADMIVGRARARADEVRAKSAARGRRAAEAEAAEFLATAERNEAEMRSRAQARMPGLLDRVARLVIEDIETPATPRAPSNRSASRRTSPDVPDSGPPERGP
ncbi:hypothetical protein SAZ11_04185 [Streptomyces sp. FXJ1.4098]|nr:hypothetical protein [Streptomyces sp. FXJ1.4098]